MKPTAWTTPLTVCDGCGGDFNRAMFDAKTAQGWANICNRCFSDMGLTLGTGKGQRYELTDTPDGRYWLKTAG